MDSILPIFYIILVGFLVIWGILFLWRTSMVLRLMDNFSKLPAKLELKPVPADEIPEAVNEALDKISVRGWHPQPIHGLEKVGDFKEVGLPGYLTLFRDDKEKMMVRIGTNFKKGYISMQLDIITFFTDGSLVSSTNAYPTASGYGRPFCYYIRGKHKPGSPMIPLHPMLWAGCDRRS